MVRDGINDIKVPVSVSGLWKRPNTFHDTESKAIRNNTAIFNDVNLIEIVNHISREQNSRPLSQRIEDGILLIIWPKLILTVVLRRSRRRHYRERKTKVSVMVHRLPGK